MLFVLSAQHCTAGSDINDSGLFFPDIAGFDRIYKKLIQIAELFDVSSSFAMEEIKYTTALPLDYL